MVELQEGAKVFDFQEKRKEFDFRKLIDTVRKLVFNSELSVTRLNQIIAYFKLHPEGSEEYKTKFWEAKEEIEYCLDKDCQPDEREGIVDRVEILINNIACGLNIINFVKKSIPGEKIEKNFLANKRLKNPELIEALKLILRDSHDDVLLDSIAHMLTLSVNNYSENFCLIYIVGLMERMSDKTELRAKILRIYIKWKTKLIQIPEELPNPEAPNLLTFLLNDLKGLKKFINNISKSLNSAFKKAKVKEELCNLFDDTGICFNTICYIRDRIETVKEIIENLLFSQTHEVNEESKTKIAALIEEVDSMGKILVEQLIKEADTEYDAELPQGLKRYNLGTNNEILVRLHQLKQNWWTRLHYQNSLNINES